jgi:hypothetical protein
LLIIVWCLAKYFNWTLFGSHLLFAVVLVSCVMLEQINDSLNTVVKLYKNSDDKNQLYDLFKRKFGM